MGDRRWIAAFALAVVAVSAVVAAAGSGDPIGRSRLGAEAQLRSALRSRAEIQAGREGLHRGAIAGTPASALGPKRLARQDPVTGERTDPDSFVVHVRRGADRAAVTRAIRDAGAVPLDQIDVLSSVVVSTAGGDRREIIAALERSQHVVGVEANHLRYASVNPDDEGYFDQGHHFVSRLPIAWEVTRGSTNVDIAILDTGVDLDHPDLDGHIVAGRDVINKDTDAGDDNGHGTMVAGIAAAETDNALGVSGVAWNAHIMPVKVLGADGSGTDANVAEGIVWAADHGAEIINLSLGAPGASSLLDDAVAYATARNVLVVAAAGNEGSAEPAYPAAIPAVLTVGATDMAGDVAAFTNYGPWVDLTAPGVSIVSTAMTAGAGGTYAVGDGTSFSAPIVSGVAALVHAKNPTWTPAQIASGLTAGTADRGAPGIDDFYGHGLLDAYGAVGGRSAVGPPLPGGDLHEPNDVLDRAKPVPPHGTSAALLGALIPEGDVDWFYVDAPGAGSITFRILWGMPSGALDFQPTIAAFSGDGRLLGTVQHSTLLGTEELHLPISAAGRYYFRISNTSPTRSPQYSANVVVSGDPMGLQPARTHTTGSKPETVSIADVTGDSRNDVLLATGSGGDSANDYRLFVFPQLANGELGEPTKYATHQGSLVTTGDVDADGDSDVVVGTPSGVDIYYQREGALVGPSLVAEGVAGDFVDIADLTGDGAIDIFTQGPSASNRSAVLTREGDTWVATITDLPRVHDPDIRDVTGDGRPDVVGLSSLSPSQPNLVRVLAQQPDATFAFHDYQSMDSARPLRDTGVGEFTGDARPDVVATIPSVSPSVLNIFAQSSTGTLEAPASRPTRQDPQNVVVTDIDDDGRDDLVVLHGADRLGIYRQTAAGTLTDERLYLVPHGYDYNRDALAVGDVNGDGLSDVAIANHDKGLVVLQQQRTVQPAGDQLWVRSVSPADFAKGIAATTRPTATFARSIDQSSISATTSRLLDGKTGSVVATTPSYDASTRRITFVPAQSLTAGRTYLVDIRNLRDTDGATMTEPFRSRFVVSAPSAGVQTRADINRDGYDDVIVGAPNEDMGAVKDGGVVNVMYGSAGGVKTTGGQTWSQDTPGIPGAAESGDQFGGAIATGDINNDGYDDVAVGAPGEDGTKADIGFVHVFLGSASGLKASGSQVWSQDSPGVPDAAETSDRFGSVLAFGDFDASPGEDLVVGSPGEGIGTASGAGSIHVLSGRSTGVTATNLVHWTQQLIDGVFAAGNGFGSSFAVGDFDGDTHDDLAVGAPGEDVDDIDQGTVTFFNGTIVGLRPQVTIWSELVTGARAPRGDRFGAALASGDFGGLANPDGYDDLGVGAPGADAGSGRVHVVFSDWIGLGAGVRSVAQTGNGNAVEAGDAFGATLAARHVIANSTAWLAIGVPGEDVGAARDAGLVHVVNPSSSWLKTTPVMPVPLRQGAGAIPGPAETGDRFGDALELLDVDRDGAPDALIGVPGEGVGSASTAGLAHVAFRTQLGSVKSQALTQGKTPVPGAAEAGDRFGAKLGG